MGEQRLSKKNKLDLSHLPNLRTLVPRPASPSSLRVPPPADWQREPSDLPPPPLPAAEAVLVGFCIPGLSKRCLPIASFSEAPPQTIHASGDAYQMQMVNVNTSSSGSVWLLTPEPVFHPGGNR